MKALAVLLVAAVALALLVTACAVGTGVVLHPGLCERDQYGEAVCVWDGLEP